MKWPDNPLAQLRRRTYSTQPGQELAPLWEAMMLGDRLARDVFSAERFRRRVRAVTITSRTIESTVQRDDAGVPQRRPLTLSDVAAAGVGVLMACGMRFKGMAHIITAWSTAAHGSAHEADSDAEVIDLVNVAAGLASVLEPNVEGVSAKVECFDGVARPFSWVLISALASAVLENWADGVDYIGVEWAIRTGSHTDHNRVTVTTPSFFSAADIRPLLLESPRGRARMDILTKTLETIPKVPQLETQEGWERFARTARAGEEPRGQEYLGLVPLWEAMLVGERLKREVFNAGYFSHRVRAVTITSRTIESTTVWDDPRVGSVCQISGGRPRRGPLTLGDVVAAGVGVLTSCGMKFRGSGHIRELGEALANAEEKRGTQVLQLQRVAAGLASVLEPNVEGASGKVECFDGVPRPFSWVLISALMSAVLENWADGVDHWGVLWAIRSLSHVDYNGVGVTTPSFFSATDIKPFLLESPHGRERKELFLAFARTMERGQRP